MNTAPARSQGPPTAADPAVALYRDGMPLGRVESHLRGVVADALASPGSLTRLRLGLLATRVLALPRATGQAFATAVEYFHTASLLLDDLPAMDDGSIRRGRPCAHLLHGESAAMLGALAFINRGYALLWQAFSTAPAGATAAAAHAERCLGLHGVLDGQSRDLHFADGDGSPQAVARTALGKTVALLRLTLVTPALLAGVPDSERRLLDRLAVSWGLAYQAADDFGDLQEGAGRGKTPGRDRAHGRPNLVVAAGPGRAAARLERWLGLVVRAERDLLVLRPAWSALQPLVDRLVATSPAAPDSQRILRCA